MTRRGVAALRAIWKWIREVSGDDAYERYLKIQDNNSGEQRLTEAEYYCQYLERKYTRPSRCC